MKKLYVIIVVIVLILTFVYILMYRDTDSLEIDFHNIVCNQKNNNVNYGALNRYDYAQHYNIKDVSGLKLRRNFVWHDFNRGCIYVQYSFNISYNDSDVSPGAHKVHSKWYIEKQNGRWVVTDIDERP